MAIKALKLQTNENKAYKVVSALSITSLMVEDYSPRFVQLYDESDVMIDIDDFDDGKVFTVEEIEKYQWRTNPCAWRRPTTVVQKDGLEYLRNPYFTNGAAEGTGSIKELRRGRVPTSLRRDTKRFFGLAEAGLDISAASDALVGGIDALRGLTEDKYYELQSVLLSYWKTCKGGNRNLSEEKELELYAILDEKVLKHTNMQRSLAV